MTANTENKALAMHEKWRGKIEIQARCPVGNKADLALAYTPGVAEPCRVIATDPDLSYTYSRRANMIAVVTDGSAVLGLGDIGPEAGMPVMEGKCVLFKQFGGVDAVPLCIRSKEVGDIVNTVRLLAGSFGGINLEDISAPRCFEVERQLKACCDIPIYHDDQHGTAVVVLAAMMNALKFIKKDISQIEVVISGSGAAGIAISRLLIARGLKKVILCDRKGAIYSGRPDLNEEKLKIAAISNLARKAGPLRDVIQGADVFIGVSAPGMLTPAMIATMAADPLIFALANPEPEILPPEAKAAGARVVCTGRSDFPNQVNNVLAFPGIFRGALDVRASDINEQMNIAAAEAIAGLVAEEELNENYILPEVFDPRLSQSVAKAVAQAARDTKVARI